jgi:hypothetical protein
MCALRIDPTSDEHQLPVAPLTSCFAMKIVAKLTVNFTAQHRARPRAPAAAGRRARSSVDFGWFKILARRFARFCLHVAHATDSYAKPWTTTNYTCYFYCYRLVHHADTYCISKPGGSISTDLQLVMSCLWLSLTVSLHLSYITVLFVGSPINCKERSVLSFYEYNATIK